MPRYRSATSTSGRNMAGARALWRATGVKDSDFGKPIIAIANSFTQFVPGHELGEGVGNRNDRLAEIGVLDARGAPQGAGTGHVAAGSGGSAAVAGHESVSLGRVVRRGHISGHGVTSLGRTGHWNLSLIHI